MVKFNTNIIKDNSYDYLFDKLDKKYGSLRTYTTDELEKINKINNLSKDDYSEINLVGGETKQSSSNTTSSKIINYYSNFPFFIFNLSLILLVLSLISNFLLDLPEIKKQFGNNIIFISKILGNIVKTICILNINISLFSIYYNSEAINNFKNKSILSYILVLLLSFSIIYFYYYQINSYIYNYKLQGVLIPACVFGLFVPLYHLYEYTYNYFYNQSKKTKENIVLRYVREIKNLYFNTVDLIPELIYTPLPNIPKMNNNNVVFSFIRNGIQSLMIDVPTGDAYQIKINLPVVKLPFVNFSAIFCCLGIYIKKLAKLIYDKVIIPIANIITPIWDKIVEIFNTFVRVVIRPIIDFFNNLVKTITDIWNSLWWNGIHVVIDTLLTYINNILHSSGLSSFLSDLNLDGVIRSFRLTKEADRINERNRKAKSFQEKKNMNNAKSVEKAANKRAVKATLSKMHKSDKDLNTVEDLEDFVKKSDSGINKLIGGGNKNICYMIKKRKDKYIKKYYKRLNNKVDINYPKAKSPKLYEEVCCFKRKLEKCRKKLHKKEKNKNKAKKYNRDYNTCKRFNYDLEKNKIPSPVCKKIYKEIELDDLHKTPNLSKVISSTYIYRFRNNVLNIERYYKIYNKTKKQQILKKIEDLQEDNETIIKYLYPIIINTNFDNKKKLSKKRLNMYFKGGIKGAGLLRGGIIVDTFKSAWSGMKSLGKDLGNLASKAYNSVKDAAVSAYNAIEKFASECLTDPIKCLEEIANAINAAVNAALEAAKAAVKEIGNALESAANAIKDLALAALNWVKDAIMSLINEAKKLMDAAKAPIEKFTNFFGDIRDFFVIQIGQKVPEVFQHIKDFIVGIAKKTVQIINQIGSIISKYSPLIIKIIKNVAKIVNFFIRTVINQFLKIPKLWIMWIKLLVKIAKATINAAMNAGKTTVKDSQKGSSNIPPLLQLLMTIVDLPFKYIFISIEKIIEGITAIFDYKTIEVSIDTIKDIFNKALDILKRIPCIVIIPISVAIDGAESLCDKFGFSLMGMMPSFIRDLFNSIMDFNNSKCLARVGQMSQRTANAPVFTDRADELSWDQIKNATTKAPITAASTDNNDEISINYPFQLGGLAASNKDYLMLLKAKAQAKANPPPPPPPVDKDELVLDYDALKKQNAYENRNKSKNDVKKNVKEQEKEEARYVNMISKPFNFDFGINMDDKLRTRINAMVELFKKIKKDVYYGVEIPTLKEFTTSNLIYLAETDLCSEYPCEKNSRSYYRKRWFDYYTKKLKENGINNTMGMIKAYAERDNRDKKEKLKQMEAAMKRMFR